MNKTVSLNYILENVLGETKLKNVNIEIVVLFACKIQTSEFPICTV